MSMWIINASCSFNLTRHDVWSSNDNKVLDYHWKPYKVCLLLWDDYKLVNKPRWKRIYIYLLTTGSSWINWNDIKTQILHKTHQQTYIILEHESQMIWFLNTSLCQYIYSKRGLYQYKKREREIPTEWNLRLLHWRYHFFCLLTILKHHSPKRGLNIALYFLFLSYLRRRHKKQVNITLLLRVCAVSLIIKNKNSCSDKVRIITGFKVFGWGHGYVGMWVCGYGSKYILL